MPNMNEVKIMGHLGQDPDIRHTAGGMKIANLSIATSYKPKNGEEQTEWHRVVCFKHMADQVEQCRKGSLVFVSGRLQTRAWEKDGQKRYTTEIVANLAVPCTWVKGEPMPAPGTAKDAPPVADDFDDSQIPF